MVDRPFFSPDRPLFFPGETGRSSGLFELVRVRPNGLETSATPTNRGWINRVAAVSRQIGAQLVIFQKDVRNSLIFFIWSVKHLFRDLAVESRVFGVLRRSWVFWKDIILLMLGLGMGPLINFLQTILMPRVDNAVGNRGFQWIRSDLRNEFPFEHFDPL